MEKVACRKSRRRVFSCYGAILLAGVAFWGQVPASAAGATAETTTTERICFVFTGSRASELESCGCQDKQTGGVDREAHLYEQLRKTYPNLVAVEAGAWTDPFQTPNERLKTDYLMRALHEMRFTVFNVTPYDLVYGTTYPLRLTKNGSGHLLSANVLWRSFDQATGTTTTKQVFPSYEIFEVPRKDGRRAVRVGIIGVTYPGSLDPTSIQRLKSTAHQKFDYAVLDTSGVLKTVVPEVRKQADYIIVLAYMDRNVARQLAGQFAGIDLVVTTWSVQALRMLMPIGNTTLINTGYNSRYFVQAFADFDAENRPIQVTGGLVDIPSDGPAAPQFAKLLEEYREDTKKLSRQMTVAVEQSRYTGRTQCLSCHNAAYLQWTRTPHNLAYATLAQKNQHYNPDCLPCHVTGYGEPDGFVDTMQTGHLVSVQCEACHEPGRAHVKALVEMMKPDSSGTVKRPSITDNYPHLVALTPEPMCVKCHDKEHDPSFDYARDLPLTSHKNVQGPFRRQKPASLAASNSTTSGSPTLAPLPPQSGVPGPPTTAPAAPLLSPWPKQPATLE
jgi:hypothetical protein